MTLDVTLHAIHLLFATFWFGSYMWSEAILWPQMQKAGHLEAVQGGLRSVTVRQITAIGIVGTILTGYVRGVAGGVFDRLYTPYGAMFLVSAVVGVWMIAWWSTFPARSLKWGWRAYYGGFWVLFAMMVGMRFAQ
ncbi:MAG: hypothetical protein F4053_14790 [Proteobacteria bacterium]|nr:hypothetical protein [Rhodospirillaceae bacterium]MDE0362697.1 hypothetical protein [Rhodospirillaceae bacterium]MYF68638.1 hypothetical protein [Pseudomonadota bacterium]MYJ96790.1 hypothetical protein [Pseudomonadota bacterium]